MQRSRAEEKAKWPNLTPFQRNIGSALDRIAVLEPLPGECTSEVALVVAAAALGDIKACREEYRTAFELLADRGYCRRVVNHWQFYKRFSPADVDHILAWPGKWRGTDKTETQGNNR